MKTLVRHFAGMAVLVATLLLVTGVTLVMTVSALPPRDGAPVVVIAAPWSPGASAMVRASGGRTITPWPQQGLAAMAVFDGRASADRLHGLGAWALVDGAGIAAFCGVS
ncbi:hypothetical protein [Sagittula stellata]|nr:hypothetical protein [Sagittula stellata]